MATVLEALTITDRNNAGFESSYTATAPAGITAGELLVCAAFARRGYNKDPFHDTPSGWSVGESVNGFVGDAGPYNQITLFYKVANGSEGNITIAMSPTTCQANAAMYMRFSGVDTSDPFITIRGDLWGDEGSATASYTHPTMTAAAGELCYIFNVCREATTTKYPFDSAALTNSWTVENQVNVWPVNDSLNAAALTRRSTTTTAPNCNMEWQSAIGMCTIGMTLRPIASRRIFIT